LKYRVIQEAMVLDKFHDFTLIHSGFLKHVWVRSGHGEGKENLRWGIGISTGGEECGDRELCVRKKKLAAGIRMI
jgi:hypothetical protein